MMTDPVADMLTRIRNASKALQPTTQMPSSNLREAIAKVLAAEGFIEGFDVSTDGAHKTLTVKLKYVKDRTPVIQGLHRASKPGRRIYRGTGELPRVNGGLGVAVISTSQGLLPDREARRRRLGGEVLCEVW